MTRQAAIQASLCDWKNVKTRSVVQLILEVPVEQALAAFQTLGMPQPGTEIPVAVALLKSAARTPAIAPSEAVADGAPKPNRHWGEIPRSQQAGILCADKEFRRWLGLHVGDAETAASIVREQCGVLSRAELDKYDTAGKRWDMVVAEFRADTGQMAEQRA